MSEILCPRCGQSYLLWRAAPPLGPFWVCDECEAVWWRREDIAPSPQGDLETLLEEAGIPGRWQALVEPDGPEGPGTL